MSVFSLSTLSAAWLKDSCLVNDATSSIKDCARLTLVRFSSVGRRLTSAIVFSAAGPRVSNNLPTNLRQVVCHNSRFRQSPKTLLSGQRDQSTVWTIPFNCASSYKDLLKHCHCANALQLTFQMRTCRIATVSHRIIIGKRCSGWQGSVSTSLSSLRHSCGSMRLAPGPAAEGSACRRWTIPRGFLENRPTPVPTIISWDRCRRQFRRNACSSLAAGTSCGMTVCARFPCVPSARLTSKSCVRRDISPNLILESSAGLRC